MNKIKAIAFDADDTLWENEPYFRKNEAKFAKIVKDYIPEEEAINKIYEVEIRNIPMYGYGVKAFILSLIECIMEITNNKATPEQINQIIELGKEHLEEPVTVMPGVKKVLEILHGKYKLVVATKGDLLDQEKKLEKSGLEKYFSHIEVMSEKKEENYLKLLKHIDCKPEEILMVGNSLKSDIVPILNLGGFAAHIPFYTTWVHEQIDFDIINTKFFELKKLEDLLKLTCI